MGRKATHAVRAIIRNGNTFDSCLLENHPRLKEGCFVTLADEDNETWWEVIQLWPIKYKIGELNRGWKIGGL